MFTIAEITKESNDFAKVKMLYLTAFPANERIDFKYLLSKRYDSNFLAFYDNETLCGFSFLLTNGRITYILFLAIEADLRSKSYGKQALKAIEELRPHNLFLADIENISDSATNYDQRVRRKNFYLRNGFSESKIRYNWNDETFEILTKGGNITEEEIERFWDSFK